ncbi:pilus assembly protein [Clostridium sp. 19966]|uniref:TadE/TadG family type IV pilus assembly protein n=1 Tax=Clostridium sp. 19966 TaxID=2768166 RepID=UPI0028DFA28F|nr:pilus assembly protein [Clostridium sp. 19966]MDT8718576.1 pilus assembly protein [Clostridium sp. 19966]
MDIITQNIIKIAIGILGMIICAAMIYRMYKVEGLSEYAKLDFLVKWRKDAQLNKLKKLQKKLNYNIGATSGGLDYSLGRNINSLTLGESKAQSQYIDTQGEEDTELLANINADDTELIDCSPQEDTELLNVEEDKKNERRKGSLTVEAALVVPLFMFAILTFAYIMNLVMLHEIIQDSINEAANEVGEYSYVYTGSGLESVINSLAHSTEIGKDKIDQQQQAIASAYETLGKFGDMSPEEQQGTINSAITNAVNMGKSIKNSDKNQIKEKAKTMAKQEGVGLICYVGVLLFNDYGPAINEDITSAIAYAFVQNQVSSGTMSADERLKNFGVVGGIDGLDFTGSKILADKKNDIDIQVTYEVKLPLPIKLIPSFTLRQNAYVRCWNYGPYNSK